MRLWSRGGRASDQLQGLGSGRVSPCACQFGYHVNIKLRDVIDRPRTQQRQSPDAPSELICEAAVNALVHREHDVWQGQMPFVVTTDATTAKTPGGPLAPATLPQLQPLNAPILGLTPALHYVFAQAKMAEEWGLDMKTLRLLQCTDSLGPVGFSSSPHTNVTSLSQIASILKLKKGMFSLSSMVCELKARVRGLKAIPHNIERGHECFALGTCFEPMGVHLASKIGPFLNTRVPVVSPTRQRGDVAKHHGVTWNDRQDR